MMPAARGKWSPESIRAAMRLYAVTDRTWLDGRTLAGCVSQVIAGGATFVQLREKDAPRGEVVALARELLSLCREAGVPFVIDDDVSIALEVGADGVHVGQEDMAAAKVRERVGDGMMIGVSVHCVQEALDAVRNGADCLGVGAVFSTSTKTDVDVLSKETLRAICDAVDVPVVAIGGIGKSNIGQLAGTGIDGVALVSAIFSADDIESECRTLRRLSEEMVNAE